MDLIERIQHISKLKKNWNHYGADPFNKRVINKAMQLAKIFEGTGFKVFPTCRDSIQFEKEVDGTYFEVEVFADKETIFIKMDLEEL